jgi:hypothetical protein
MYKAREGKTVINFPFNSQADTYIAVTDVTQRTQKIAHLLITHEFT